MGKLGNGGHSKQKGGGQGAQFAHAIGSTVQGAATAVAAVAAVQQATVVYQVVAPKRPLTGSKFGAAGNLATFNALAAAAQQNGGTLTGAQAMAVCVAQSHKGFYSYAINRLHVLQPVTQAPVTQAA